MQNYGANGGKQDYHCYGYLFQNDWNTSYTRAGMFAWAPSLKSDWKCFIKVELFLLVLDYLCELMES